MNEYDENYQELSAEEQAQINRQEAIDQGRDPDEPHPSQFSDYDQYVAKIADYAPKKSSQSTTGKSRSGMLQKILKLSWRWLSERD